MAFLMSAQSGFATVSVYFTTPLVLCRLRNQPTDNTSPLRQQQIYYTGRTAFVLLSAFSNEKSIGCLEGQH